METRANFAVIGAFTLAVVLAALSFVAWFSGSSKQSARKAYRLVFTSSVSGLSSGSMVTFNGLRVGEVKGVDLGEDPNQVVANIEVAERTPVKTDTRARLEYQGLTGVASVALTGGGTDTKALAGPIDNPPTIQADRSDFQNIVESLQKLSAKVDTILETANALLKDNSALITDTVKNADVLTQRLATSADGLNKVLDSAQTMLNQPGARELLGQANDAAAAFKRLADNLDKRSKDIADGLGKFSNSGLRDYQSLAADGKRTLDELNRTVRSLQRNPQQLLLGPKPEIPEYNGK